MMNRNINRMAVTGISVLFVAVSLSGCLESIPRNPGLLAGAGAIVGGGAGYGIGKAVGGKHAEWIGTATGVVVGGLIGSQIAKSLDERDRQAAARATQDALNTPMPANAAENGGQGATIAWDSDHNPGVRGRTTIVNTGYDTAGRECRAARQIAYVGGREIEDQVNYCRDQNSGVWTAV